MQNGEIIVEFLNLVNRQIGLISIMGPVDSDLIKTRTEAAKELIEYVKVIFPGGYADALEILSNEDA